nr:hypothetical protein [Tanacetum cinerariifolium]
LKKPEKRTKSDRNRTKTGSEDPPEVPMADNRTMGQLLQVPTVGYEDAIVIPEIAATNFVLKHDKMPSDCLKIIESRSKVRQSRAKAVVAKVNSSSSTLAISFDVAEHKDMVRALLLDKKNQSSAPATSPTPAPVKAAELGHGALLHARGLKFESPHGGILM